MTAHDGKRRIEVRRPDLSYERCNACGTAKDVRNINLIRPAPHGGGSTLVWNLCAKCFKDLVAEWERNGPK